MQSLTNWNTFLKLWAYFTAFDITIFMMLSNIYINVYLKYKNKKKVRNKMKPTNPNSLCVHGCKHSKKCKVDKSNVIECGRYKPTEEWTQIMMELKSTINSYNARKRGTE